MGTAAANPLTAYHWTPQPMAEKLVRGWVDEFLARLPAAVELAGKMKSRTGTRFFDWIDHLIRPELPDSASQLTQAGFVARAMGDHRVFVHEQGMFPMVQLTPKDHFGVAIKVESIADFAAANDLPLLSADEPGDLCRRLLIARDKEAGLWAIERHGYRGLERATLPVEKKIKTLAEAEKFRTRRREFALDLQGFDHLQRILDEAIAGLGPDLATDRFFAAEREYWQRRNRAAQAQKARQDRLGLGWANHDHHTYRSSRRNFSRLIAAFEKLGFHCRERFYAGAEAGWGAQILEQPTAGIVIFADVDLAADELMNDFAHEPLEERKQLGTVGLWCGLHGDSIFEAGMHHLECQFDFDALKEQLSQENIQVMKPFTDFPYLRQAFTEGERWPVRKSRLAMLRDKEQITAEQAEQFLAQGAIGSHLENLERNEGFKGFNQTGVSAIISKTDPRKHLSAGA